MIQNGIIFRDEEDQIWLGKYEDGTIKSFESLADYEGFYDDLPLERLVFVEIDEQGEQLWIKDLFTFTVGKDDGTNEDIDPVVITQVLEDLGFPSEESDDMFASFLTAAGKAN